MSKESTIINNTFSWMFSVIFIVLGVLNLIYIHPVPGLFYIILSLILSPPLNALLRKKLGFSIPLVVKAIVFLVVMWATLAVGDLAEMYGL